MPITKPSTWENGFKNSPQAETTQLREMGVYLNTKGEFEAVDTSWTNVLNKTPALFYFGEVTTGKGIYLTQKGIGIGIDPTAPGVDFVGTLGAVVDNSLTIYETSNTTSGVTALTVGTYNNSYVGGPAFAGIRAEWNFAWAGDGQANLFCFDYDAVEYKDVLIDGQVLKLNTDTGSGTSIQMFDSTGGNVAIGGASFGSSANFNLAIYNGTAPGSSPFAGISIYAESGAAKVRGSGGTITTFGAADPHCQRCGKDFAMEWENEKYGKLAICAWCLSEKFEDIVIEKYEGGN